MKTVRVSGRGAARWRAGHPWIYRSDIVDDGNAAAGGVQVQDERGRWMGVALYSPRSLIGVRMLSAEDVALDVDFWRERVAAAQAYRDGLEIDATAYRMVHAEADGLPSLVVDRYGDALVVQLLSAGLETYRPQVMEALQDVAKPAGILARHDVGVRRLEGLPEEVELLHGTVPEQVEVREGAVRYLAAPWTGQKTGAFLDQRENRVRAGALSRGRALDCFAYHGSFALHLAQQATHVTAVDSSAEALGRARDHAERNDLPAAVELIEANVFDFLRAEEADGRRYHTIVLDPPAFAKRRESVERALRGYKDLNLRALRLLEPGGHLCTFSCSFHIGMPAFHEMLESAAADAGRPVRWIEWRGQARDHPELVGIPETTYLKGAVLQAV